MEYSFSDYQASAQALKERIGGFTPEVLLILGSGQVDIPAASAPRMRAARISAGVSYCGPGKYI